MGVVEKEAIADGLLAVAAQTAPNNAMGLARGILDDSVGPVALLAVVHVGKKAAPSAELDGRRWPAPGP